MGTITGLISEVKSKYDKVEDRLNGGFSLSEKYKDSSFLMNLAFYEVSEEPRSSRVREIISIASGNYEIKGRKVRAWYKRRQLIEKKINEIEASIDFRDPLNIIDSLNSISQVRDIIGIISNNKYLESKYGEFGIKFSSNLLDRLKGTAGYVEEKLKEEEVKVERRLENKADSRKFTGDEYGNHKVPSLLRVLYENRRKRMDEEGSKIRNKMQSFFSILREKRRRRKRMEELFPKVDVMGDEYIPGSFEYIVRRFLGKNSRAPIERKEIGKIPFFTHPILRAKLDIVSRFERFNNYVFKIESKDRFDVSQGVNF